MSGAFVRILLVVSLTLSASPAAFAASRAESSRAKELYQKATAHYGLGEYEAAAEAYQEAYKLKSDPALLYNAAQSYRLAGNLQKALTIYRNYTRLYPDAANIDEVRDRITKVEEQMQAERTAAAMPPAVAEPPPAPLPVASPALAPAPATSPQVDVATSAPAKQPLTSSPLFWGVVGSLAAVAIVAVVIVASSGGSDWANAPEVKQGALSVGGVSW